MVIDFSLNLGVLFEITLQTHVGFNIYNGNI